MLCNYMSSEDTDSRSFHSTAKAIYISLHMIAAGFLKDSLQEHFFVGLKCVQIWGKIMVTILAMHL